MGKARHQRTHHAAYHVKSQNKVVAVTVLPALLYTITCIDELNVIIMCRAII